MTKYDVCVIGAGLFGQIIAAKLRSLSAYVLLLDVGKKGAGSPPAACLMKPGWFAAMGREVYDPALETLDDLYGLRNVEFSFHGKRTNLHWVPPSEILSKEFTKCEVTRIRKGCVTTNLGDIRAKHIVVAAGIWSRDLVPGMPEIIGKAGVSFTWSHRQIAQPFIKLWAPYKHLTAFNITDDEVWVGDGRTILDRNWREYHTRECLIRCSKEAGLPANEATPIYGIRPYVKTSRPCYLKFHEPGIWVATGGAKNGTIAAAWCANELEHQLA